MATIGTTIEYNGQQILGCQLRDFSQDQVLDDSNTDRIYDRIRVSVTGQVHLSSPITHGTTLSGNSISDRFTDLQNTMLEPRKHFRMFVDNDELFIQCFPHPVTLNSGSAASIDVVDVCNGPHPLRCTILQIISNRVLRIAFDIELCMVTTEHPANTAGILSNRWGWTDVVDKDWFTKRVLRGRMRVSSNNIDPQALRQQFLPKLQKGFKRELIEVTSTPDGLNLDYTVVDAQLKYATPFPGTTIEGTHVVTQPKDGTSSFHKLDLLLSGSPDVEKQALMGTLIKLFDDRTTALSGADTRIVEEFSLIDYISDTRNAVGLSAIVKVYGANSVGPILDRTNIGKDFELPNYNPKEAALMPPYGTTNGSALAICFLQNPWDDNHNISDSTAFVPPDLTDTGRGDDGTVIVVHTSETLPDGGPAPYSDAHKQAPYTHYQVDTHHQATPLRAHMAVGTPANSGSQDTATIVTLGKGPVQQMIVRVAAERAGAPPTIPDFGDFTDANGITHWLLETKVRSTAPQLMPDGTTYIYGSNIEFVYGMSRPLNGSDQVSLPALPWQTRTLAQNQMNYGDQFGSGIVEAA